MDIKQQIGQRIKELRLQHNLKQSELAEIVGIATKHQSCIETGRNFPSAELFERYTSAFGINAAELFSFQPIVPVKSRKEVLNNIKKKLNYTSDFELSIIEKFINSFVND